MKATLIFWYFFNVIVAIDAFAQTESSSVKSLRLGNIWVYKNSETTFSFSGGLWRTSETSKPDTVRVLGDTIIKQVGYSIIGGTQGRWYERNIGDTNYILPSLTSQEYINFIYSTTTSITSTRNTISCYCDGYGNKVWYQLTVPCDYIVGDTYNVFDRTFNRFLIISRRGWEVFWYLPKLGLLSGFQWQIIGSNSATQAVYPQKIELVGAIVEGERYGTFAIQSSVQRETLQEFEVFPNPVENQFSIKSQDGHEKYISVFNMLGQKIIDKQTNQDEVSFDLGSYSKGVYIVKIISRGKTRVFKVIKSE